MNEFILGLLKTNQNLDYTTIIPVILGYVVIFWIIVSFWVFIDAKKRFHSVIIGLLIALGNLIFQIPFLLLFLLFRPLEEEYIAPSEQQGGVNVPIVNFIGEDGVAMSLELKIHNRITPQNASEMKIDVSFDSNDDKKQLKDLTAKLLTTTESGSKEVKSKIISLLDSLKNRLPKAKVEGDVTKSIAIEGDSTIPSNPEQTSTNFNSKKKKKKNKR